MSNDLLHDAVSRRVFLARMTAAGLGTAAAALIAGCGGSGGGNNGSNPGVSTNPLGNFADPTNFPGIPGANENVVVLNFALTLETLEADLYRQALNVAAGQPITAALPAGNANAYTLTASSAGLTAQQAAAGFQYLQQFAYIEAAHRDFLRAFIPTLGGTAVPANPKGYSAAAAGLVAGASLSTILAVILTAEETGVSAYLGAAPFLNNPTLLQAASSIYSTEARHSAVINLTLGKITGSPLATAAPGPYNFTSGAQPLGNAKIPATFLNGSTAVYPGTAEFAVAPPQILNAIKPFFVM